MYAVCELARCVDAAETGGSSGSVLGDIAQCGSGENREYLTNGFCPRRVRFSTSARWPGMCCWGHLNRRKVVWDRLEHNLRFSVPSGWSRMIHSFKAVAKGRPCGPYGLGVLPNCI